MPLISSEISLSLTWSANCVMREAEKATRVAITDIK